MPAMSAKASAEATLPANSSGTISLSCQSRRYDASTSGFPASD